MIPMALTDLICPKCGVSSKEKEFAGMFCIECKSKDAFEKTQIPICIKIQKCKKCGKVKIKRWNKNISELEQQVVSLCKGNFEQIEVMSLNPDECKIDFVFSELRISETIPVKISKTLCDNCTREVRGYYEAIIQLRGEKNEVKVTLDRLVRELKKTTFLPSIKEFPFGFDIYVGSVIATRAALAELGLKALVTRKLFGLKAGRIVFRTTFLIRH